MQRKSVWSLVWEDPKCGGTTKPVRRNYWGGAPEPKDHSFWAHVQQLLKPACPGVHTLQQEEPPQEAPAPQLETSPCSPQLEKAHSNKDPAQPKLNFFQPV